MYTSFLKNKFYYISLALIVILGVWIRLKGLGKWPLAVDEYYIVKSMENILKYGIPQFEAGGLYDRGLLYQYITSFLFLIGFETEFAARLIPVISSVLVIPPIYLLGKKISGPYVALIVTFLITFSLWEIEFARFARMYSPFQAAFVWYIYFLYKVIIEKNEKSWKWLFTFSLLAIFIYEGSVFLLALNFLPFLVDRRIKIKQFTISSILILLTYFYIRIDFRSIGSSELLPQIAKEYHLSLPSSGGLIKLPPLLINYVFDGVISGTFFILILVITIYSLIKIFRNNKSIFKTLLFSLLFILTLLNQFGLAAFVGILLLLLNWIDDYKNKSIVVYSILTILLHLSFWTIFSVWNNTWYAIYSDFEPSTLLQVLKRVFVLFFNYPGTYSTFWMYYVTIPNLTFIVFVLLLFGLFLTLQEVATKNKSCRFLYLVLIFTFLIVTYLVPGIETRYTFFLYPVALLLLVISIKSLSSFLFSKNHMQYIFVGVTLITLLYFSEDHKLMHTLNIDDEKYNFRTEYNERLKRHYYRRYDIKTPAEFVNNNIKDSDVVLINEMVLEYYLKKIDYIFIDYQSRRFPILSTHQGEKERWTNADLIYSKSSLMDFLQSSNKEIWFIVHKLPYIQQPLLDIEFYKNFKDYLVFQSLDEMVNVYKITPKKNSF